MHSFKATCLIQNKTTNDEIPLYMKDIIVKLCKKWRCKDTISHWPYYNYSVLRLKVFLYDRHNKGWYLLCNSNNWKVTLLYFLMIIWSYKIKDEEHLLGRRIFMFLYFRTRYQSVHYLASIIISTGSLKQEKLII